MSVKYNSSSPAYGFKVSPEGFLKLTGKLSATSFNSFYSNSIIAKKDSLKMSLDFLWSDLPREKAFADCRLIQKANLAIFMAQKWPKQSRGSIPVFYRSIALQERKVNLNILLTSADQMMDSSSKTVSSIVKKRLPTKNVLPLSLWWYTNEAEES